MLDFIHIQNFKSLKNLEYHAVPLNVLMGLNGSGKSSFLQALLLLKQSAPFIASGASSVPLNGDFLTMGTQSDVCYCYNDNTNEISIEFSLQNMPETQKLIFKFSDPESDMLEITKTDNLIPESMKEFSQLQYISANRLGPQQEHIFLSSKISAKGWGMTGENAVAYLAEYGDKNGIVNPKFLFPGVTEPTLQAQVNAWMSTISPGTNIHADKMLKISKAILSVSFASGAFLHKFRPQNVGFGISYTLPIVIMLLAAKAGDSLMIENPEAHIHPRGQAELGRLISLCAENGIQIFLETHSDHVINGIRVAVKKQQISQKKVNIAYFTRRESIDPASGLNEQYSEIQNIKVDKHGEMNAYPDGFMDEWNNQLMELL